MEPAYFEFNTRSGPAEGVIARILRYDAYRSSQAAPKNGHNHPLVIASGVAPGIVALATLGVFITSESIYAQRLTLASD